MSKEIFEATIKVHFYFDEDSDNYVVLDAPEMSPGQTGYKPQNFYKRHKVVNQAGLNGYLSQIFKEHQKQYGNGW